MKTTFYVTLLSIALILKLQAFETEISKAALEALAKGNRLVLYSLDPGPVSFQPKPALKPGQSLDGFKILGMTELKEPQTRDIGKKAMIEAISASDFKLSGLCFRPRHALRVIGSDGVYDFVICYECHRLQVYYGGKLMTVTGIPKMTATQYNKLLPAAKIPLAEAPPAE